MIAEPTCTGCGRTATQTGEYSKSDPVEEDGTYQDGKFVCTACYCRLIPLGQDVGSPAVIQMNARQLTKGAS